MSAWPQSSQNLDELQILLKRTYVFFNMFFLMIEEVYCKIKENQILKDWQIKPL